MPKHRDATNAIVMSADSPFFWLINIIIIAAKITNGIDTEAAYIQIK